MCVASVELVFFIFVAVNNCSLLSLSAVRSVSFAGSVQRAETSWMGEDVKQPVRGLGLSSLSLQEKKGVCSLPSFASLCMTHIYTMCISPANRRLLFFSPALVSPVSVAVEAILAHFSSSRTVVQKVSRC